jgi:hypothetical protein
MVAKEDTTKEGTVANDIKNLKTSPSTTLNNSQTIP